MHKIGRTHLLCLLLLLLFFSGAPSAWSQDTASKDNASKDNASKDNASAPKPKQEKPASVLTLSDAAICEEVKEYRPYNRTIAVSTALGKAICYTAFDPVPEDTVIYHNWYRFDAKSTAIRLKLQPPRWATFSTIQLRESDKGPWRVEITDKDGRIFRVLRFSITD
jgi:hypothetical protein